MSLLRLAFFSPLNPERSGISDYSEELLEFLGDLAEIEVVTGPYRPSSEWLVKRFPVIRQEDFLRRQDRYDCAIYQIGNSFRYHSYMLPSLRAVPGIVVLHDCSLSYLVLGMTLLQGDLRSLRPALLERYGPRQARRIVRQLLFSSIDPYEISLARPVLEMSRAIIVHNEFARDFAAREAPTRTTRLIPHATPIQETLVPPADIRRKYGFGAGDFLVASVSVLTYNKRLPVVLHAIRNLTKRYPFLKFLLVGQGQFGGKAKKLIERLGIQKNVVQTGWLPLPAYLEHIAMADVVVDLRYPASGETSGSALRAIQAGKPIVVSAQGPFLEMPADFCIQIPVDGAEERNLGEALSALIEDPQRRERMGRAARNFALENLRIAQAAQSYLRFAQEVVAAPMASVTPFPAFHPPAWERSLVALVYRSFRVGYLLQHYGFSGAIERIRKEYGPQDPAAA